MQEECVTAGEFRRRSESCEIDPDVPDDWWVPRDAIEVVSVTYGDPIPGNPFARALVVKRVVTEPFRKPTA